jgi:hypothetical protein
MKNLYRAILSTGLIASMSFAASANLITNGSFEQGNTLNGSGWEVYQSLGGGTNDWTTVSGTGIEIQANGTGTIVAQDGTYKVELDSDTTNGGGTGSTNTLMAQLVQGLVAGSTYDLSVWYSPRTTSVNTNAIFAYAGDAPTVTTNPGFLGEMINGQTGWQQYSFSFIATSTNMLIGFGAEGTANEIGGYIDNVKLTNVPAPSGLALIGLALLGLRIARKKLA